VAGCSALKSFEAGRAQILFDLTFVMAAEAVGHLSVAQSAFENEFGLRDAVGRCNVVSIFVLRSKASYPHN
jgi:hypothetical protein